MVLQISLTDSENDIIQKYAAENKISLPELFLQAVLEKIADEEESARLYNEAIEDYKKNPVAYTHAEVGEMLGLAGDSLKKKDITGRVLIREALLSRKFVIHTNLDADKYINDLRGDYRV